MLVLIVTKFMSKIIYISENDFSLIFFIYRYALNLQKK